MFKFLYIDSDMPVKGDRKGEDWELRQKMANKADSVKQTSMVRSN